MDKEIKKFYILIFLEFLESYLLFLYYYSLSIPLLILFWFEFFTFWIPFLFGSWIPLYLSFLFPKKNSSFLLDPVSILFFDWFYLKTRVA